MKTWQILGYLGLIPFVGALYFSLNSHDWNIDFKYVFVTYSAIILSFISGTLWQVKAEKHLHQRQIISNIFSLLAFFSLLTQVHVALMILAISYMLILLYEKTSHQTQSVPARYIYMRFRLTLLVVSMHIIAWFLWLT